MADCATKTQTPVVDDIIDIFSLDWNSLFRVLIGAIYGPMVWFEVFPADKTCLWVCVIFCVCALT